VQTVWRDETRQNLKPLAGVGVTDRCHEETEAKAQHDDVQHECSFARFDKK
jgi:hypothetical protein